MSLPVTQSVLLRCIAADRTRIEPLALRLGLALHDEITALPPHITHVLEADEQGLCLRAVADELRGPSATRVDFLDAALLYRLRTSGKRQGLGQALGLQKHPEPQVLDATAGLGRDALLMAHLGCRVLMLERSPLIHALLEDGLARARASDIEPMVTAAVTRLQLEQAEAREWLQQAARGEREPPDVVYLDPMFPPRNKSAKVKKDIALLHDILGAESDFASLLQAARAVAKLRVVVKRPGNKGDAELPSPTFTVPGKTAHFEVYVSSSASSMR
jgi:16S rRNA (guanine1516-N2)-methyltransferase